MKTTTRSIPVSDTNSELIITFKGDFGNMLESHILNTVAKEILNKPVYFNDLSCRHWSYDFKSACGYWIENINYTDSMRKINCIVYEGSQLR